MPNTSLGMHEITRAASNHTVIEVDGGGFAILDGEGTERERVKTLSLKTLKAVAKTWGLSITRDPEWEEYRVNKIGGREATAAYTGDPLDAINTGIAMAKKGAW